MANDGQILAVTLEAKLNKLEAGMRRAGVLTDTGYRRMEARAKQSSERMDSYFTNAFKGIARSATVYLAPLALIGAAGALGKNFIEKTVAQQNAVNQLNTVLKSTKGVAGVTSEAAQKLAASLQKVTTYGDETILSAQSLLLTFTNIKQDVFPQATETVLDMSKALGQDLKSSATQLGKALQDPIQGVTALRRVGVNFSTDQQKVIKNLVETGRQAEAQKLILRELQTEFGGTARAARDTLGGAIEALGNALGDAFELHGPEVDGLREKVEDLIDTVSDPRFTNAMTDIGQALFNAMQNIASSIITIDEAVHHTMDALDELHKKLNTFGNSGFFASTAEFLAKHGLLNGVEILDPNLARQAGQKLSPEARINDAFNVAGAAGAADAAAAKLAQALKTRFGTIDELAKRSLPALKQSLVDQRNELTGTKPHLDSVNGALGNVNTSATNAASGFRTFAEAIHGLKEEIPELAESLATLDAKARIDDAYQAALAKAGSAREAQDAARLHDQALHALTTKDAREAANRGMLDLIGFSEGTDKGRGYNETLGYGRFTGGNRNLVTMSLDDIDKLQTRMLADPSNTFGSSALGRFQITRRTLRGLRSSLGLSGSDLFDRDMQDRLAQELLRQRGNNPAALRKEWTSLARVDDATIRKAYDGTSVDMPAMDVTKAANVEHAREQRDEYARIIADSQRYIAAQAQERQALDMTAVEASKLRHEQDLLNQAKDAGIKLSPHQRTEIGKLAAGMAESEEKVRQYAQSQKDAAEAQRQAAEASRYFGEQATSALSGILTGSMSAEQALQRMLQSLIEASIQASLLGEGPLAGLFHVSKGGIFGKIFGFSSGGYTGDGGKYDPAGLVHRGEYVMSADAVRTLGASNLDQLHRSALKGYSDGGLVGRSLAPAATRSSSKEATTTISISAPVTVNASGGTPEQNSDLAKRIGREMEGTMRGVVADEMRRQMRAGNMIANAGRSR
ncbi:phage tail length tape measure family protein [Pararhizobium mangrovi]|uniref:Phage tail tape measure protein n=1 Tax=Pararhizobium mangrovi TaxID=2590452 RepID=A0A506U085_9HYPH|nr:phage tail length tape measure family protein [Pararhizobium mangrovi]TPW26394.1 hypothetical protein FJU11_15065 [Pararhizobium mangrovi]